MLTICCLLVVCASERLATAQQSSWIDFAPNKSFHISMPGPPKTEPVTAIDDRLQVSGIRYLAGGDGASYAIWSLVDLNHDTGLDQNSYLDAAADLFRKALLRPPGSALRDQLNLTANIAYVKELPADSLPGREYSVVLGQVSGTAHIFVADQQIFVLLAAHTADGSWERERFLNSFKVSPEVKPLLQQADPKGPQTKDDEPVFTAKEVDQRPHVLEKPEPSYTESARTFQVRGTVVLRAVFSRTGEVTRVEIIRRLPHGMTERCVVAARAIKFSPAIKDGKPVSTWIQLEYNFNLF